ncbi:MAG TPA: PAS and helix-turn-helix domain-containing protein [Spirochaetia bacterium]|nr:PAS and helix-turn-helix domain-containing protein [Spirochaetia bacterium]
MAMEQGSIGWWWVERGSPGIAWSRDVERLVATVAANEDSPPLVRLLYFLRECLGLGEEMRRAMEDGTQSSGEREAMLPDGRHLWFHSVVIPARDGTGAIRGIFGTLRDLTEQKTLTTELRRVQSALLERNAELERKDLVLKELLHQVRPAKDVPSPQPALELFHGTRIPRELTCLSPREVDVCLLIQRGLASKQIAQHMEITLKSVESHRVRIRRKLKLGNKNLAAYLRYAFGRLDR